MDKLYIVNSVGDPSDYMDAALNQDGQWSSIGSVMAARSRSRPMQR